MWTLVQIPTDADVMEAIGNVAGDNTPMWLLLLFVLIRWLFQWSKDRTGPGWVRNGAMDKIIENFTSRLVEENATATHNVEFISALANMQVEIGKISVFMDGILARHAQYQEGWPKMVSQMEGCSVKMDSHAKSLEQQSKHMVEQGRIMQAIARELNATRLCKFSPADAAGLAEDFERRRSIDAHTRAEDLGLNPKEKKP